VNHPLRDDAGKVRKSALVEARLPGNTATDTGTNTEGR
jgi:hypothetical protein